MVDPKKSNKSECEVYPDHVVTVILRLGTGATILSTRLLERPHMAQSKLSLALPESNWEMRIKSSSDKVPTLVH
jgi:hypothetical protein